MDENVDFSIISSATEYYESDNTHYQLGQMRGVSRISRKQTTSEVDQIIFGDFEIPSFQRTNLLGRL